MNTCSYNVFGNQIDNEVSEESKYRYTGQEYDEETDLHNYKARFYDSMLMRFYSVDPAEEQASPYTYCANNPVMFTDPSGKTIYYPKNDIIYNSLKESNSAMKVLGPFLRGGKYEDYKITFKYVENFNSRQPNVVGEALTPLINGTKFGEIHLRFSEFNIVPGEKDLTKSDNLAFLKQVETLLHEFDHILIWAEGLEINGKQPEKWNYSAERAERRLEALKEINKELNLNVDDRKLWGIIFPDGCEKEDPFKSWFEYYKRTVKEREEGKK